MTSIDGTPEQRRFVGIMLAGWPELKSEIFINGFEITYAEMTLSSGVQVIIDAMLSLNGYDKVRLSHLKRLDPKNRAVFIYALTAYLQG